MYIFISQSPVLESHWIIFQFSFAMNFPCGVGMLLDLGFENMWLGHSSFLLAAARVDGKWEGGV